MPDASQLSKSIVEEAALQQVAAISSEADYEVAERPNFLRRGMGFFHDLGKIALHGDLGEAMVSALRRAF